jgi:uncharacterized protein
MANWGKISARGNVEDRRSLRPAAIGGIGLTGVLLILGINLLLGGDPVEVLNQLEEIAVEAPLTNQEVEFSGEDSYEVFVSTVLGSNNQMWEALFAQSNLEYPPPRLVLFRTAAESACGHASSQVGPHYCPNDQTIYLDETFFEELTTRYGAQGGDVAEAYVISHEVGHHVQNLLGMLDVQDSNEASIEIELTADCMAGLWAHSIKDKDVLLPGEIQEAMDAAAAVGDDRIQKSVSGQVSPETWTHGSSEARLAAFTAGYDSGRLSACNLDN